MRRVFLGVIAIFTFTPPAFSANEKLTVRIADGFDFPVGKPDTHGYHRARGFTPGNHLGEDWDGDGGGDSDLGDPVNAIGNGVVVFAADVHLGWGNVVILRHCYLEKGQSVCIDSLYGHLDRILVQPGESVERGQKLGTIGTAHGMYPAHLHFEIRKNLTVGMNRSAFAPDFSNYYDPTQFIRNHRSLDAGPGTALIAVNTFQHPANYYSGPTGTRYATNQYDRSTLGDSGVVHYRTLTFNISSGDEPVAVQTKRVAKRGAFKVSRYDDMKLN
jgi:murein DD-endopeptidase MepM/ murein hydrolase activator NlpD